MAREPTDGSERCSLRGWKPRALGASVVVIPAAAMREVMTPVIEATCRCTHDGDRVNLLVRFWPERGEVRAEAPEQADIGGCLARVLAPGHFTAFSLGSDCIDCGPRRIWPTTRPPAAPSSNVTYPVVVDRTDGR